MSHYVIGVDPGVTTGIALFDTDLYRWDLIQCNPEAALWIVEQGIDRGYHLIAIERFVVGPRSARSAAAKAGQVTRDLIGALSALGEAGPTDLEIRLRTASEVKPWATDKRLLQANAVVPSGMRHAADAARHALFAAVKDSDLPDPLSVKVSP